MMNDGRDMLKEPFMGTIAQKEHMVFVTSARSISSEIAPAFGNNCPHSCQPSSIY